MTQPANILDLSAVYNQNAHIDLQISLGVKRCGLLWVFMWSMGMVQG